MANKITFATSGIFQIQEINQTVHDMSFRIIFLTKKVKAFQVISYKFLIIFVNGIKLCTYIPCGRFRTVFDLHLDLDLNFTKETTYP